MAFKIDEAFKTVLDQLFLGVQIVDRNGRIVYLNKRHVEMDGLTPKDVLGYKISEVYAVTDEESPTMMALRSGRPVSKLMTYKTARGKQVTSVTHSYPLHHQREVIGVMNVMTDVSSLEAATLPFTTAPRAKTERQEEDARVDFDSLIGISPLFREAVDMAKVAAGGPSPVMLIGETGTGKDLFAKAIHDYSVRAGGRFTAINCSAIPEALLEGLLFGTAKGAFTGATDREGLLEHASGGTLFLDEINSMPLALQAKLLRVLQDHKVRRVGGLSEKNVDLRLISATNQNPLNAVADQCLRADLYYRLGVMQVYIPPLRERPEDIPYLARHFIGQLNLKLGKTIAGLSDDLLQLLKKQPWPGNIRELEHVIESAMNFGSDGEVLSKRHFRRVSRHIYNLDKTTAQAAFGDVQFFMGQTDKTVPFRSDDKPDPSDDFKVEFTWQRERDERFALAEALTLSRGIISQAARYLGLSPQLTSYRMKKYQLSRDDFLIK